jgi:hypothetical protein
MTLTSGGLQLQLRAVALIVGAALLFVAALLPTRDAALLLIGVGALSLVLATLVKPEVGLAAALIAGPFQPLERVELRLPIDSGQALLALSLFAFALRWLARGNVRNPVALRFRPIPLALGVFSIACVATYFSAWSVADWLAECLKLAQMLAICLIVAHLPDRRGLAIIVGALLISAAGEAMYGVTQHRLCWSDPLGERALLRALCGEVPPEFKSLGTNWYRGYGTFEQPNPFGGYMGLLWPWAAGLAGAGWASRWSSARWLSRAIRRAGSAARWRCWRWHSQ